jgi:prepilin-type N-terminal cleavage/methylation domain-containing protein
MKIRFTYKSCKKSQKGFTLVEIIIVAALISLFSGLATFGVNQMLNNNKLKAVIGETRQVGSSLIFAHQDIGFYPKIGFMMYNADLIDNRFGWDRIDSMGLVLSLTKGQFTYNNWKGPYFAASQTRNQLSARFKSIVTMRLTPQFQGYDNEIPWPADQWGNPYVLYLFKYDPRGDTWQFIQSLGEEPNFWASVVSYGPNGVPGTPTSGTFDLNYLRDHRLFIQQDTRVPVFDDLDTTDYSPERKEVYSLDPLGIGMVDPGSDDLIYTID